MAKKIGILTGGGDAPGLNAVVRAVVINGIKNGYEVHGFMDGWAGVLNGMTKQLTLEDVEGIHRQGGTIIGTSRTPIFEKKKDGKVTSPDRSEEAIEKLKKLDIYALIALGGNDTVGEADKLYKTKRFPNVIGVPKTIDNDLNATDYTFGFNTAVNIATEAMDRLHTTTKAHHRVMVVEIMGRDAGWMTLEAGMAGGAHIVLIPEVKFDFNEVCSVVKKRYESGKDYTMIAVAEGCEETDAAAKGTDAFGNVKLGGIGKALAEAIQKFLDKEMKKPYPEFKYESRSMQLGHLQRGGAPTAFDRVLGTRLGIKAVDLVKEEKFGVMVALSGTDIIAVPLEDGVKVLKTVPTSRYEEARLFLGM